MKFGECSKVYEQLMEGWELPLALMGGTRALRAQSQRWLPQWSRETERDYQYRVGTTALYNSFKRTVRVLSSKPFSNPVKIVKVTPTLEVLEYDVDRKKSTISRFARTALSDMLTFGLCHFLVDMPAYRTATQGPLNKAAERDLNIHPYFSRIRPDQLIDWTIEQGLTGDLVLTQIQIRSDRTDDDGKEWWYITQWTRESIITKRQEKDAKDKEKWEDVSDVPNELGSIPLVTAYSDVTKIDEMQASCPLEDLADLNLRHYHSQSDQNACLHFARVPFLHFAGFDTEEVNKTVAASNAYVSKRPEAKITWVETTGAALAQGANDLDAIEARMDVMGADLMVQKPGNPTATAKSIDTAEKVSDLQAMVISLEGALERGYEIAGEWTSVDARDTDIQLDTNFGLTLNDARELDFLLKARVAGEISRELFYAEIQRRGVFEEFDTEEELNRVALEHKADTPKTTFGETS
jgi:hypothetical protein